MIKVICWWGRGQVVRVPGAGAMVRVVAEQPDALRAVVGGAAVPAEGVRARACHPGAALLFLDALATLGAGLYACAQNLVALCLLLCGIILVARLALVPHALVAEAGLSAALAASHRLPFPLAMLLAHPAAVRTPAEVWHILELLGEEALIQEGRRFSVAALLCPAEHLVAVQLFTAVHAGNDRGTANRAAHIFLHAAVADRSGEVRAAS